MINREWDTLVLLSIKEYSMTFKLAGAFCLCSALLCAGDFTIKHPNGYVNKSTTCYWDDKVIDPSTRARVSYPGIVLHSQGEANIQITIFIMGYKGPGRYPLMGTKDIYANENRASNVFYSNMGLLVVDPSNSSKSWVEITEDKAGVLSGTYQADVAYPIGKEPRMTLSGEFVRVEKNKD